MNIFEKKLTFPAVFIIIAIITALSLSGCFSPLKGNEATITINLGADSNARAAYPPTGDIFSELEHRITLQGPTATQRHTLSKGKLNANFSVTPGLWEITVEAWLDGELYAIGSSTINAKTGQPNVITIKMRRHDSGDITYTAQFTISAVYDENHPVYTTTPLDDLKTHLTVTAAYTDGVLKTLNAAEYSLSGTLAAGTSTVTVSYTEGGVTQTTDFTVTVNEPPAHGISLSAVIFQAASYGYGTQAGQQVTVTNIGTMPTGGLSITIDPANGFDLSEPTLSSIDPGGKAFFTVTPKPGLNVGVYNATITLSNADINEELEVSFTVNKAVIIFSVSPVNYINDGQTALTPLSDGSYNEGVATITVTVGGFISPDDATAVGLMCNFEFAPGSDANLEVSGRFPADGIFYPATNTKIFTVRVTYDGTASCASGNEDIEIWPDPNGLPTTTGYAAYSGGQVKRTILIADGVTEDTFIPVHQDNITHFNAYANTTAGLSKHYKLTGPVILDQPASGSNWTPIGTGSAPFTGTFDGSNDTGYTISGLRITGYINNRGLFGYVGVGGTVKKLTVQGSVTGDKYVGGIVGVNTGTVEDCISSVNVSGNDSVGGVVGTNGNADDLGEVQRCSANGNITSTGGGLQYFGGVVGENPYLVKDCSFTGTLSAPEADNVGGVVGNNTGMYIPVSGAGVENCYATGNVTGGRFVGGVVGQNGTTVKSCYYTTGIVTSTSTPGVEHGTGGVVGVNSDKVQYCYSTGSVSSTSTYSGGVVGENSGTVEYCYATGDVTSTYSYDGINYFENAGTGGVVGFNNGGVQNCYATGYVLSYNANVGGVVGNNSGTVESCYTTSDVTTTTTNNAYAGGVVGDNSGTVSFCYSTGTTVTGINYVGGVAGYNNSTVSNCVALKQKLNRSSGNGSVFARVSLSLGGTNNYARGDMILPTGVTPMEGATNLDGAPISSANWGISSWWTGTAEFPTAAWSFDDLDGTKLPTLRDMPGEAQNPAVQ